MDLRSIQEALKKEGVDGWLFYDFHNRDHLAYRILGLDFNKMTSRRWFYYIPADGESVRLVHSVEKTKLDPLPGKKMSPTNIKPPKQSINVVNIMYPP